MDNENKLIGDKLLELRTAHNYTQAYIADNINVKQPTYQLYESGKRKPGLIAAYKLAHFYGLTLDELMQLCVPLDDEIFYDSPEITSRTLEEAEYLSFADSESYSNLRKDQIDILYHYEKLNDAHKAEVKQFIDFKLSLEKK